MRTVIANYDERNCILIGRSSGAVVMTRMAALHTRNVLGVVAIGYPFRHPVRGDEPYRASHLPRLRCPTLIFQGDQDEYGDAEHGRSYPASPEILIEGISGTHGYHLSAAGWRAIGERLTRFIEHCRQAAPAAGGASPVPALATS